VPDNRSITCYHCRHRFEIGAKTLSTSCPKCSKQLRVDDIVVKGLEAVRKIQTCGSLVVQKKGRVNAQLVEAHLGVEVDGVMEANVLSGGPVRIGAKAVWKGNCNAPVLVVELGAQISSGLFSVPDRCVALPEPEVPPAGAVLEPKPVRTRERSEGKPASKGGR
jgi:cytoskeletal protein CcmA (bactofilin family)